MKKTTLINLKKENDTLKVNNYESDFDFSSRSLTAKKYITLFKIVMDDLKSSFGIKTPKMQIAHSGCSHVTWHHFRGDSKNKWVHEVVLSDNSSCVPEYDVIHEIAHIVEHFFTGSTSNRHGKKFFKYFDALKARYALNNI